MAETHYPNRWFGSNPQAVSSQGKRLSAFSREVPKDWRAALGIAPDAGPVEAHDTAEAATAE